MTPFTTHEVFNQSPPFEDVDLYSIDRPLVDAVVANGGAAAAAELSAFGRLWGSVAMAARGRIANENTPKLRSFDARGFHNATWTADGRPAGGATEVVRAAKFYMAAQVETGHRCPVTMTRASIAALAAQPDLPAQTMPVISTRAYDRPPVPCAAVKVM